MKKPGLVYRNILVILFVMAMLFLPSSHLKAAVKLNKTSAVLVAGKTTKLTVKESKLTPVWTSANATIASISSSGKVKALKAGTTIIYAKVGTEVLQCKIDVVALNATIYTFPSIGSKATLRAFNGKNTKWKSSNSKIVKVSSKGVIKAKKSGIATITCTTRGKKIKCKVAVPKVNMTSMTLPIYNTKTFKMTNTVGTVVYTSANPSIVKIDSKTGLCTGLKRGFTYVIARSGAATMRCAVTVGRSGDIFTPASWVSTSTKKTVYTQKVKAAGGKIRYYRVYGQGYTDNGIKNNLTLYFDAKNNIVDPAKAVGQTLNQKTYSLKSFIPNHGCAACSTTTVLSGYTGYSLKPSGLVTTTERNLLGWKVWNENYSKSSASQMPLSLYGVSQILSKSGVKNTYVRSFKKNSIALSRIADHLLTGKPVVIVVGSKNAITGKTSSRWTGGRHTMVLLGMTDTYKVIVADPADRSSIFGSMGRIKLVDLSDVGAYLFSTSKSSGSNLTKPYYTSAPYCGGYILVDK